MPTGGRSPTSAGSTRSGGVPTGTTPHVVGVDEHGVEHALNPRAPLPFGRFLPQPTHEEHVHLSEWVGRQVDATAFDLALVNAYLQAAR